MRWLREFVRYMRSVDWEQARFEEQTRRFYVGRKAWQARMDKGKR